jgi:hypothetical protein
VVYLAPKLSVAAGSAAMNAFRRSADNVDDMVGALAGAYLAHGVVRWTFERRGEDGRNEPVPIDRATIDEYLSWGNGGELVANAADDLYSEDFLRPLGVKPQKSSPDGQTEPSTSVSPPSGPSHPKPSKRSSQNGSDGSSYAVPVR